MSDKERLEEIKNSYLEGIHILFGTSWVSMPKEKFDWLINRVEELEEGVKEAVSDIENISPHEAKKTLMDLIKNMEGET
jgi:hypothetical protein